MQYRKNIFNLVMATVAVCFASGCAKRVDEIDEKVEILQKRTAQLEQKGGIPIGSDKELLENQKLADVRSQVAAMRNELTVLAGKMEALEFENKNLQMRMDEVQKQSETLKRESDRAGREAAPVAAPKASNDSAADDAESAYNQALRAHQDGDFEKAEKLFDSFVKKNPKNSLADNAIFWVGEGFMVKKQYRKAITKFQDLIEKYPKSDKRCDALGKQISALKELKMDKEAKAFTQVRNAECSPQNHNSTNSGAQKKKK